MINIVAHGIMGASYRRDVVYGDGLADNDLATLFNIRHLLSTQYGDAPMLGWALQPTPSGIWLSRIERAFDTHFSPAFVMVSFLVPFGISLPHDALSCIERTLTRHHSRYVQQGVVLQHPDWSFLSSLAFDLYNLSSDVQHASIAWRSPLDSAFWPNDACSMIDNIWDRRFRQFRIVFCGTDILSSSAAVVSVDTIDANDCPVDDAIDDTIPVDDDSSLDSSEGGEDDVSEETTVYDDYSDDANPDDAFPNDTQSPSDCISVRDATADADASSVSRWVRRIVGSLCLLLSLYLSLHLLFSESSTNNDSPSSNVNPDGTLISVPASLSTFLDTLVDDSLSFNADTVGVRKNMKKNPDGLFLSLTWENVCNNGAAFYEKYEFDRDFKSRVESIIKFANRVGEDTYRKVYQEAFSSNDPLTTLAMKAMGVNG